MVVILLEIRQARGPSAAARVIVLLEGGGCSKFFFVEYNNFILSKGAGCLALYAMLYEKKLIHKMLYDSL